MAPVTKIPKAFVTGALPWEGLNSAGHPFTAQVDRVAMQSVEGTEGTWYRYHLLLLPIDRPQLPAGESRGQSLLTWTFFYISFPAVLNDTSALLLIPSHGIDVSRDRHEEARGFGRNVPERTQKAACRTR
jgi:hypothetical protein